MADDTMNAATRHSFSVTTVIQEGVAELCNVGLCHYPNWQLSKARKRRFRLNLLVIGQPGVGRSSLINTLFSTAIVPEQRDRMGAAMDGYPQLATYVGDRVEGGVRLQINVAELLGYTSPARLQEEGYSTRLLDYLRQRHYECHRAECQPVREVAEIHDGLVHAVLYLVPPTFQQFSDAELELFRELQKLTLLVPVIPKADMYTAEELKSRKMMIRAQFKANAIDPLPDLLQGHKDTWLANEFEDILGKWPLAVISSTKIYRHTSVDGQEGIDIRARVYPWGVIDIDDAEYSDLLYLEKLLVTSFYTLNVQYTRERLYEGIWRPLFLSSSFRADLVRCQVIDDGHKHSSSSSPSPILSDSSIQATPIVTWDAFLKHRAGSSIDSLLSSQSGEEPSLAAIRSSSQGSVKAACSFFESRQTSIA